jgi:hypothetical protein
MTTKYVGTILNCHKKFFKNFNSEAFQNAPKMMGSGLKIYHLATLPRELNRNVFCRSRRHR